MVNTENEDLMETLIKTLSMIVEQQSNSKTLQIGHVFYCLFIIQKKI